MKESVKAAPKLRRRRRVATRRVKGLIIVKLDSRSYQLLIDTLLETLHKAKDARARPGLREAVLKLMLKE